VTADQGIDGLRALLPDGTVVTDPEVVSAHSRDQTALVEPGVAVALVRPSTAGEVQDLLRWAHGERVPVVPRGAGSGLAGGAAAVDGCVILSLERMDRIGEVDTADGHVVVEPGVITADVKQAAAEVGLWYPPDPASAAFCTIGGNIATNAGGLCCLKYGVTRDYVMGLEVVLADGTLLTTGRSTVKGVAAYDLTSLLVGSEGTLGVVTRAKLRLRPAQGPRTTLVALFETADAATRAAVEALGAGADLSLLEFVDRTTLAAIDRWRRMGFPAEAGGLLVAQSDTALAGDIDQLAQRCTSAGALYLTQTDDVAEADALLEARRLALPALERLGQTLLDDVCVPRSRLGALVEGVERIAEEAGCVVGVFGHLGDGNMHPTFVLDPDDPDAEPRARAAFGDIVRLAVRLGGTVSGEHGVGVLKLPYLADELGAELVAVQHRVKQALDPTGILNPGKKIGVR
jgi:glycolate oxidase